ncbi:MAG: aspartate kinase [Balneolaceae bacterium]|nr:MAG: aspartate kinase [Balneolaceae bacterium]
MAQLQAFKKNPEQKKIQKTRKLFIAGVGAVGNTLLKQISRHCEDSVVRVIGVCNSRHALWFDHSQKEYSLGDLQRAPEIDWDEVLSRLFTYDKGSVIFVDTTGSREVASLYPLLLGNGVHIVTPSKLANTQLQEEFDTLHFAARENNVEFRYETNVGAGLPVIHTVKSLVQTGDRILELNGVLSGTMTYLFSELENGGAFSETVIRARQLGYAEPDPRDDLSGEDVARKFMILARISGIAVERDELEVESLIPCELQNVESAEFLNRLPEADARWNQKIREAESKGETLRYTGRYCDGKIKIGVESVPKNSALGQLKGTNNILTIRSARYNAQPLTIQGPGAGKEVTAAGVLADILSIKI